MKQLTRSAFEIRVPYSAGFEKWFLLTADHHWDNPHCDRKLLKEHLEEAKKKDAGVFVFGDMFCAMQGKYDRRSSKSDIRPEHQNGNYLDSLVDTAVDWYGDYSQQLQLVTPGNHETAVRKRHETDLTSRFVTGINDRFGSNVKCGTYSGWVIFRFHDNNARVNTFNLSYHHGYGGGGPVTKGVIQTNRKAVYLPDADIVVQGHIHESWYVPIERERIGRSGKITTDKQKHICLPTYKDEYTPKEGFHIEGGRPPKPLGGWWLKFYLKNGKVKVKAIETD